MNYYQHHIGDFNNATLHLTEVEECMYHRALAWYYSNEKPLPLEKAQVYRYLRARSTALKNAVDNVLADFFVLEDDGYHQSRCDEEIAIYHGKAESASKAGKASAAKRAEKSSTTSKQQDNSNSANDQRHFNERSTDVESTFNDNPTNQEPITNNQKPITKVLKNSLSQNDDESDADQPILVDDWMPDFDDIQKNLRELGFKTCDQAKFDLVLAKFKKHNSGKRELESPLDLSLCNWINNERDSKPVQTKERKQSPSDQQEPQRTTDTTKTKERTFDQYHDSQVYSGVFTAGKIRKALQPNESPDQCVLRLTKEQFAKAGA